MKKRLLAFLMCAVMIIGIFPGAVFAEEVPTTPTIEEGERDTEGIDNPDADGEKDEAKDPEQPSDPEQPVQPVEEPTVDEPEQLGDEPTQTGDDNEDNDESLSWSDFISTFAESDENEVVTYKPGGNEYYYTVDWKLFDGYSNNQDGSGYCNYPNSSTPSPTVSFISAAGNSSTWSSNNRLNIGEVKKGTVTITPPNGYYVRQVVICCDDQSGYHCETNKNNNVKRNNYTPVNGTSVNLNLSEENYWHYGMGYPSHLMIWLVKSPDPVTVKYESGLTGFTGDVSNHELAVNNVVTYTNNNGAPSHKVASIQIGRAHV